MPSPTIRIRASTRHKLLELASRTGESPQLVLEKAVEHFRRKLFFEELDADYAALRADPKAWNAVLAERRLWDSTLMDGLDPDESWSLDGRLIRKSKRKNRHKAR